MSKRPHLEELDYLFDKETDFQLTSKEYESKTGVPLPKSKNYLCNDSALARWAKERGYVITDIQEECIPERTVKFKRKVETK